MSLHVVPLDGSAAPLELSTGHGSASYVRGVRSSPDGSQVAYLLQRAGTTELFRAPADGSAPPTPLSGALVAGGAVQADFQFTPDGSRVVYRADQDADETIELYSADGLAPPVKLNPPLTITDIAVFQLTADGERVVFPADPSGAPYELMSAPVDGSAAAISIGFPPTKGVRSQVSPVGGEVVYADAGGIHRTLDDAASPVTLVTFAPGTGQNNVLDLQLTPDGAGAVYVADQLANEDYELFSVPVDGSGPSVELSPVVAAGGDITQFRSAPGGTRVVYLADQGVGDRFDLYSVPVDTRAGLVKLDPPLQANRDVADFQLSPDGTLVAYRADQDTDDVQELFAVPIDARRAAVKLHRSLAAGDVAPDFAFTSDSRQVLFRMDGEKAPSARELSRIQAEGEPAAWLPRVHAIVAGGALEAPADFAAAARLLLASSEWNDLLLAHVLALAASFRGLEGGARLVAETLDRYLLASGRGQLLGTILEPDGKPREPWKAAPEVVLRGYVLVAGK